MAPNEVATSYNLLAEQWKSEAFLKEKHTALDLGCGSSGRIIDLLIGYGFEVEGLDISAGTKPYAF